MFFHYFWKFNFCIFFFVVRYSSDSQYYSLWAYGWRIPKCHLQSQEDCSSIHREVPGATCQIEQSQSADSSRAHHRWAIWIRYLLLVKEARLPFRGLNQQRWGSSEWRELKWLRQIGERRFFLPNMEECIICRAFSFFLYLDRWTGSWPRCNLVFLSKS